MNKNYKCALDIDDILSAFTPHAHAFHNVRMDEKVDYWCERTMDERLGPKWFTGHIAHVEEFWLTLPILSQPKDIDFEFECYISSFPAEMYELRKEWLLVNKFPDRPLVAASNKLEVCQRLGIGVLIDDKPATIKQFNDNGLKGIHFHNHYAAFAPVGDFVVNNLNQVKNFL